MMDEHFLRGVTSARLRFCFWRHHPSLINYSIFSRLPNLRRLTLHSIRGDQMIELHKVFCVNGIDELNIIQPVKSLI